MQATIENTVELNLEEQEFNLIWNILNEIELDDEIDEEISCNVIAKMQDLIEEFDPEFFDEIDE